MSTTAHSTHNVPTSPSRKRRWFSLLPLGITLALLAVALPPTASPASTPAVETAAPALTDSTPEASEHQDDVVAEGNPTPIGTSTNEPNHDHDHEHTEGFHPAERVWQAPTADGRIVIIHEIGAPDSDPAPDLPGVIRVEPGSASTAEIGAGYTLARSITSGPRGFVVRMHPNMPPSTRAAAQFAVDRLNTIAGAGLTIGADSWGPAQQGEILVLVRTPGHPCQGGIGCAMTFPWGGQTTAAEVLIDPAWTGGDSERDILLHEFGHAVGLDHFNELWEGLPQIMRWAVNTPRANDYRSGDINGLRRLFGSTRALVGNVEGVRFTRTEMLIEGWAVDINRRAVAPTATLRLDGGIADVRAEAVDRPDVVAAWPGAPLASGFRFRLPLPTANRTFSACVDGRVADGGTQAIGCVSGRLARNPIGALDLVALRAPGIVNVSGWALDPDTDQPLTVHLYANGRFAAQVTANGPRPDVARVHREYGPARGYSTSLNLGAGRNTVCSYGINVGSGEVNSLLGCRVVTVGGNPIGNLDAVAIVGPLTVRASGWSLDPDTTAATDIHFYAGNRYVGTTTAATPRPDVARAYPGFGDRRGYTAALTLPAGRHQLCAYAINEASGNVNSQLGCRVVTVGGNPIGSLDAARQEGPGELMVAGWSLDPDTGAAVTIRVRVNGQVASAVTTDSPRPDVERAHPGFGRQRGFSTMLRVPNGSHRVCVEAVNAGARPTTHELGCRTAEVGGSPRGGIDTNSFTGFAKARVSGWALDPDTSAHAQVRITINGRVATTVRANATHNAAAQAFPRYGNQRGFTAEVDLGPADNEVCATIVNVGRGSDSRLGCTVLVASGSPRGTFDAVSASGQTMTVRGWALDPDTANASTVTFTLNGRYFDLVITGTRRSDVERAYPGFGPNRGFEASLPRVRGATLCATVRNVGSGADYSLGCKVVP